MAPVDLDADPRAVFEQVWRGVHSALNSDRAVARFLPEVEASPLRGRAHQALKGDPLTETGRALTRHLVDRPLDLIYELGLAPALRLVVFEVDLTETELGDRDRELLAGGRR